MRRVLPNTGRYLERGAEVRTVVVDTNVLLSDPEVLNGFTDAHVVIPEMVLPEIDKLKTARVDPELRFKGRQVSRILFELSERGSLHDGVEMGSGSVLRIVGLPDNAPMPSGLSGRNADDRIIAVALSVAEESDEPVTLVTNDLNMLLKAQSFGLHVERVETDDSFVHRFLVRPFQRYRAALGILAVALAVFAAAIYLTLFSPLAPSQRQVQITDLPSEFLEQLSVEQQQALTYLIRLQKNPRDLDTLVSLATVYDNLSQQNTAYLPYAVKYWEKVIAIDPNDDDSRTDLATDYFRQNKVDDGIRQLNLVLAHQPDHINANLNLGVMYMSTNPKQFQKAADQFTKVMALTKNDQNNQTVYQHAQALLDQVKKEAEAAGQSINTGGSTL